MKKYILVSFVFTLSLILLDFNVKSASATPIETECAPGDLFSTLTGKSCNESYDISSDDSSLQEKTLALLDTLSENGITLGKKGEDVKTLQRLLKDAGFYSAKVDGSYGRKTAKAVNEFQKAVLELKDNSNITSKVEDNKFFTDNTNATNLTESNNNNGQPSIILTVERYFSPPASSQSALNIEINEAFVISGKPTNVVSASGFDIKLFSDSMFSSSCNKFAPPDQNSGVVSNTWRTICSSGSKIGTGNFYAEIYKDGKIYRSNTIAVTVIPAKSSSTSSTPTLTTTFVPASSTSSQSIPVGTNGANDFATKAVYKFVSNKALTITELKFVVTGANTVTNIRVGDIVSAGVVNDVAHFTGLNLQVPNNGSGLSQDIFVAYAPIGPNGVPSGSTSSIALTYIKYSSGGATTTVATFIPAPTMTLVSSTTSATNNLAPTISSILPEGCPSTTVYNSITGESCTSARVGYTVYIYGSNFGNIHSTYGTDYFTHVFTYNNTSGDYVEIPTTFISSTSLSFVVPSNIGAGNHVFGANNATFYSNKVSLNITSVTSTSDLTITTPPLLLATVGVPYENYLSASGGTGIYSWTLTSGSLPVSFGSPDCHGNNCSSSRLYGTPTDPGTWVFGVSVASGSQTASKQFTIRVDPATIVPTSTLTITTPSPLPDAQVGVSYTKILDVSGGPVGVSTNMYVWSIPSGSLPAGLGLSASTFGEILNGTPSTAGTYTFTLLTSYGSQSGSKQFTLTVDPATTTPTSSNLNITTNSPLNNMTVGLSQNDYIEGTGDNSFGFGWSILEGSLPPGLSLVSHPICPRTCTGIGGIPTTAGTYQFTIQAQVIGSTQKVSKQFSLTVNSNVSVKQSIPTASLTVDKTIVNVGDTINYQWNSTNADTASSSYTVDSQDTCALGTGPFPWSANTLSGSTSATVAPCQAGHTYTISYFAFKGSNSAQSKVVVLVNAVSKKSDTGNTGFFTTYAPAPTAYFMVDKTTANVGDIINYTWSTINASSDATASSWYTVDSSDKCREGTGPFPWLANTLSGSTSATVASCQSGHTYNVTFYVQSSAGNASRSVSVRVNGPISKNTLSESSSQVAVALLGLQEILSQLKKSSR